MRLKQQPEDFVVRERNSVELSQNGPFAYFTLYKRDWNTMTALQVLAKKLNVPLPRIGFAGNKDRQAVTEQVCSVRAVSKDRLQKLALPEGLKIEYLGHGEDHVHLGSHESNAFEIIVRDLDLESGMEPKAPEKLINYFGEQRFSVENVAIGRAIVQRDFKKAVELLLKTNTVPALKAHIAKQPNESIGAIRTVPHKLLRLFIGAYQSKVWNEAAAIAAEDTTEDVKLPLPGFAAAAWINPYLSPILEREGLKPRSFIIHELPELSSEGVMRPVYVYPKDMTIGQLEEDELNNGKKKVKLTFTLPPGSYATVAVEQVFG